MKVKDQIHNINLNGSFKTKTGQNIFREHNRITRKISAYISRFIDWNSEMKMVNTTEMVNTKQLSIL